MEPALVQDIEFLKPKRGNEETVSILRPLPPRRFADPTGLLEKLKKVTPNAAIFSVTDPKRPVIPSLSLPPPLSKLHEASHQNLSSSQVMQQCDAAFSSIAISQSEAILLERETRNQHSSSLWMEQRCGRLTASKFGDICKTSIKKPSKSLISDIMQYKTSPSLSIPSLKWGREKEATALDQYREIMEKMHADFRIRKSGLYVSPNFPHLGASPDAICECSCCGKGVVEVKAPFSKKNVSPCSVNSSQFFLSSHVHKEICDTSLRRDHSYFFQVQGHMAITDTKFCDFVVYTTKGVHIERVTHDRSFCQLMTEKLDIYFKEVILPEITTHSLKETGNCFEMHCDFAAKEKPVSELADDSDDKLWCTCQRPESYDDMVGCDGPNCPVEWYHMTCVGLSKAPSGKWLCVTCKPVKRRKTQK